MRRRALMNGDRSNTIRPSDIKVLLPLNGVFTDMRGHAVNNPNTYNNSWIDGVFNQAAYTYKNTGSINISISDVFTTTFPSTFTVMYWGKDGGCYIGICCKSYHRIDEASGLTFTFATKPYVWKQGKYANRTAATVIKSISTSGWHNYGLTYDNGAIKWFFDGEKYAEYTIDPSTDTQILGNRIHISNIGTIDEFMYSDKVLITGDTYSVPVEAFK